MEAKRERQRGRSPAIPHGPTRRRSASVTADAPTGHKRPAPLMRPPRFRRKPDGRLSPWSETAHGGARELRHRPVVAPARAAHGGWRSATRTTARNPHGPCLRSRRRCSCRLLARVRRSENAALDESLPLGTCRDTRPVREPPDRDPPIPGEASTSADHRHGVRLTHDTTTLMTPTPAPPQSCAPRTSTRELQA